MTDTVKVWQGEFGDDYTARNTPSSVDVRRRVLMWSRILPCMAGDPPRSALEVGCNLGVNLQALQEVSDLELYAIEPNAAARSGVISSGRLPEERMLAGAGSAIPLPDRAVDLAFTSGVLIHVPPGNLGAVADEMHRVAAKYILVAEYFAVEPEERTYRGKTGLLFKRDFGGYFLDRFADLRLVDYGFFWRRATGLDDLTWWVLRKA